MAATRTSGATRAKKAGRSGARGAPRFIKRAPALVGSGSLHNCEGRVETGLQYRSCFGPPSGQSEDPCQEKLRFGVVRRKLRHFLCHLKKSGRLAGGSRQTFWVRAGGCRRQDRAGRQRSRGFD